MISLSFLLEGLVNETIKEENIINIKANVEESKEGDLLFLLNEKAIENYHKAQPKVSVIVSERRISVLDGTKIYTANNVRRSMAIAYKRAYCNELSGIKFIGITGTNGKSTTAMMIEKILKESGYKTGLFGTGKIKMGDEILSDKYYSMTTPPPQILYPYLKRMIDEGIKIVIMEVSSHALIQERAAPISFDIGIFTNLSPEHLDYHKDMESYYKAKEKLFNKSKIVIINQDDEYGNRAFLEHDNTIGCAINSDADTKITDIEELEFSGTKFDYRSNKTFLRIHLKLAGPYNIYNAMLAIKAAEMLNVPSNAIKSGLESIEGFDGRFEIIKDDINIIIDYAHTLSAFTVLIKTLYSVKKQGQSIILVFGCGGERDKSKRGAMGEVAQRYADKILVTNDNPRGENPMSIINDITSKMNTLPMIVPDRAEAIRKAIQIAEDGDIVAIIGKGPERYSITVDGYNYFNERDIINHALGERHL